MTEVGVFRVYKQLYSVFKYRGFTIKVYLSDIEAYDAEIFDEDGECIDCTMAHETQYLCVVRAFYRIDVRLCAFYRIDVRLCDDFEQAQLDKDVDSFI